LEATVFAFHGHAEMRHATESVGKRSTWILGTFGRGFRAFKRGILFSAYSASPSFDCLGRSAMSDHLPHHLCRAVPWLPRERMLRLSIKLPQLTTGIAKPPVDVFHRQPSLAVADVGPDGEGVEGSTIDSFPRATYRFQTNSAKRSSKAHMVRDTTILATGGILEWAANRALDRMLVGMVPVTLVAVTVVAAITSAIIAAIKTGMVAG
jgi:hypothetical protein